MGIRLNDAEQIGEDLGNMFINFIKCPLPKKILVLIYLSLCCGIPYYFLYSLKRNSNHLLLRGE